MNNQLSGNPYHQPKVPVRKAKKLFWLAPLFIGIAIGTFIVGQPSKKSSEPTIVEAKGQPIESPPRARKEDKLEPIIAAALSKEQAQDTHQTETNAATGIDTLPAGGKEVEICTQNLSPTSQVYLSAEEAQSGVILFVKKKVPFNPETGKCSHFVAATSKPVQKDLNFHWWIID